MSQKRQSVIFDRQGNRQLQIATLTYDYPAGHVVPLHFHDRDQLVYASRGVMTVRTEEGTWVVPTHRAVWIPATVPHTITMSGTVAMRTLYFKPRLAKNLAERMLRGKCVAVVEGADFESLHLHGLAEDEQVAGSIDRSDHRPVGSDQSGSLAASQSLRPKSSPGRGCSPS